MSSAKQDQARAETLIEHFWLCEIEPERRVKGIGYPGTTQEGKLAAGYLPGITGTPRARVPNVRFASEQAELGRLLQSDPKRWTLAWMVWGAPLMTDKLHTKGELISGYAIAAGVSEATAWRRHKDLIRRVVAIL